MTILSSIVEFLGGTPQFRIRESLDGKAPTYFFYGQPEIDADLNGLDTIKDEKKLVRTFDSVNTVNAGDVLFSLISGRSTIVQHNHAGYLFTQNYVLLTPTESLDSGYLVYMLNENHAIKRQLQIGQQGSATLKYTIQQLSNLAFPSLPPIKTQRIIGKLYFNQLKLATLKSQVARTETTLVLGKIKEAIHHE